MTATSRFASIVVTAFVVLLSSVSHAAIVFDNFGPGFSFPDVGRILQGELVGNIANIDQAASFINGPSTVFVTDVKLGIYVDSPANSPFDGRGPLDVIIASDAGGLPGAALHTTSLNVNNFLSQVVDAPVGGVVQLNPNTQYWIIADAKGTFDGAWEYNPINDFGPVAGRSNNGPWSLHNANDPRLVFQVQGRLAAPEPTTIGLLTIGLVGIASMSWRRKQS
jgi:PEP-CTERM motif